jgi:hypothetical protein
MAKDVKLDSRLFRYPAPGAWTFSRIPEKYAPVTAP